MIHEGTTVNIVLSPVYSQCVFMLYLDEQLGSQIFCRSHQIQWSTKMSSTPPVHFTLKEGQVAIQSSNYRWCVVMPAELFTDKSLHLHATKSSFTISRQDIKPEKPRTQPTRTAKVVPPQPAPHTTPTQSHCQMYPQGHLNANLSETQAAMTMPPTAYQQARMGEDYNYILGSYGERLQTIPETPVSPEQSYYEPDGEITYCNL